MTSWTGPSNTNGAGHITEGRYDMAAHEVPEDQGVTSDEALQHFDYHQELARTLTFRDLLIYGMVFMVPIAPMGIYGFVSSESFGMVPTVYLIGIIAMFFTALSYRHLSREFTIAGSVYSYVQRGLNAHIGFLCGWMIF